MSKITLDSILQMHLDHGYTFTDQDRILDRFPIPGPDADEVDENIVIGDLRLHEWVTDLCAFVKVLYRGVTRTGKPYLKIDLSDESGRIPAMYWGRDEMSIDRLVAQIGTGKLADLDGYVSEWPEGSGNLQFTVRKIDFASVHTTVAAPRRMDLDEITMQLVLTLEETLTEPYQTLVLKGLEQNWEKFRFAVSRESFNHRYASGVLTYAKQISKVIWHIYRYGSSPVERMINMIQLLQPAASEFERDVAAGAESLAFGVSIDQLYNFARHSIHLVHRSDKPANLNHTMVAAAYLDIGQAEMTKFVGSATSAIRQLRSVSSELKLSFDVVAPIEDLIVTHSVGRIGEVGSIDGQILQFATYLVNRLG